jgi:hypothetical protein
MVRESEFSRALQLIYDAALDFARWPAVLEQLAESHGASMTCMVRHDITSSKGAMITVRTAPDTAQV